jgi:hypothetical protein
MMHDVRTTLTIDDDLAALLHEQARRTGRTFRDVVNEAIRDGLLRSELESPCIPPVHDLGIRPGVDLTKALQLVGQLEDEEIVRKMEIGK